MAANIKIGFSIHPGWIYQGNLNGFLDPLRAVGLSALEFELDSRLAQWQEFEPLMENVVQQGLDLSFHAPYRLPHSLIGFAADKNADIACDYQPMLDIAHRWSQQLGAKKMVVIHGARANTGDHAALLADTRAFLDWTLETYPDLDFALENNNPAEPGVVKIGASREEVLRLVKEKGNPRLNICWDMGHDFLGHREQPPSEEWLQHVRHVHIHDVDEKNVDHYPLIFGRVPIQNWLGALKQAGMQGIIVLELKGGLLKGYAFEEVMNFLTQSIAAIAKEVQ